MHRAKGKARYNPSDTSNRMSSDNAHTNTSLFTTPFLLVYFGRSNEREIFTIQTRYLSKLLIKTEKQTKEWEADSESSAQKSVIN